MPEVHINFIDFLRYSASAVLLDMGAALDEKVLLKKFLLHQVNMTNFMHLYLVDLVDS